VKHACPITLNHGAIGNGRVLALVSPSTHIDWLCMPRFDSASVFGRILDVEKGGTLAFQTDYRHKDDFGDTTSAFSICSFWWAEALAMVGRLDDACRLFERLMTHANCVGLFPEDIEPRTGMLLGNFPQAIHTWD
jgi:GH15 family glucan-1,4-alpha-glucosidase